MPFTQSFDQFFIIAVLFGISIYLLRIVLGIALLVIGAIPSRLGATARTLGQQITPRLMMKIITTFTGLLVAATGVGASTALATPAASSSANANTQSNDAEHPGFDSLADLIAIDRGPTDAKRNPGIPANGTATKAKAKTESKVARADASSNQPAPSQRPKHTVKEPELAEASKSGVALDLSSPTVTVRQGDTLWSIAAKRLGPHASDAEIDQEWRRWYRVNVKLVGPNPHLIVPGMKLEAPQS